MQKNYKDPIHAYAPMPASVVATRIRLGSWFQRNPLAVQILAIAALIAGATYLTWRVIFTLPGANPVFFWPLFLAEAFGYVTFFIMVFEAWRIAPTPRLKPLDVPVDILIATYNEELDVVLPTVVGALKVRGNTTVWLCDDGRRPEMKKLAKRFGINYQVRPDNKHAKAGNINAVLPKLKGELILVLDADHVPSPDFLEATSGYFADPKIALIQTAHSFRNHNSVMHEEEGRHEQSLFFDVLLPGRNRLKSVFWCGSAGLLRRSALVEVGGMATETSTEDFETSLLLQVSGYEIKYHNEHLVQGLAPDNLNSYIIQRFRWAQGTLGSYRKGHRRAWSPKLNNSQRLSYTGGLLYHITPVQRLTYTLSLFAVALFAAKPFGFAGDMFLWFWGSWVILSMTAVVGLERGVSHPFEGMRNNLIVLEAFLRALPSMFTTKEMKFVVTPKNEVDLGGWPAVKLLRLPLFLTVLTIGALTVRWADVLSGSIYSWHFLSPLEPSALTIGTSFGVLEAGIITSMAVRVYNRRQYRKLWRFPVDLPALAEGHKARIIDLHHAGAGVIVASSALIGDGVGQKIALAIQCKTVDGKTTVAQGILTVSNVGPYSQGGTTVRVGGPIEWRSNAALDTVVEQCYVVEPYVARNIAWARRAPRIPVELEAKLGELAATCIDISISGAAFLAEEDKWQIGDTVNVTLRLEDGVEVLGALTVRNVTITEDEWFRIGGETAWAETSWLYRYTTLAMVPDFKRKRSPIPIFSV
mgnify:CR=1 FL=1